MSDAMEIVRSSDLSPGRTTCALLSTLLTACSPQVSLAPEERPDQGRRVSRAEVAQRVVECGAVITTDLTLAGDLTCPAGFEGPVFRIAADGVTLDGDGHAISATDAGTVVSAKSVDGITVRSLRVFGSGGGSAVDLDGVSNSLFESIHASGLAKGISAFAFSGNPAASHDNVFRNNTLTGHQIALESKGDRNTYSGNDFSGSGTCLLIFGSSFSIPDDNDFSDCGAGLRVSGSVGATIEGLSFPTTVGTAVGLLNSSNMIVRNLVIPGTGAGNGIDLNGVANSLVEGNLIADRAKGISATAFSGAPTPSDGNTFRDNTLRGHHIALESVGNASTFSHNVIEGSQNGIILTSASGVVLGPANELRDNVRGLLVNSGSTVDLTENAFERNTLFAVETRDNSFIVRAHDNYWGDPRGPFDRDVSVGGLNDNLGLFNLGTSGDPVTDFVDWSGFYTEPGGSALDRLGSLRRATEALLGEGRLDPAAAAGILDKIDKIATKVENGMNRSAANQLGAVRNQISGLVADGDLEPEEGQSLLDAIDEILARL